MLALSQSSVKGTIKMTMNVDKFIDWAKYMQNIDERRGFVKEFSTIAGYINKITKDRLKQQKSPSGKSFEPVRIKKLEVGDFAKFGPVYRPIRNERELNKANRKRGAGKQFKALYRTTGKKYLRPAKKMFLSYTRKSGAGHVQAFGKDYLRIGSVFNSAYLMQHGNPTKNVPARPFYGMNDKDVRYCQDVFLEKWMDRVQRSLNKAG